MNIPSQGTLIFFFLTIILILPLFVMSTPTIPSRVCLTCEKSGDACDGVFPTCKTNSLQFITSSNLTRILGHSCKSKRLPCYKANVEVELPWERNPSGSTQTPYQNSLTADTTFTEEYIRSEHGDLINSVATLYETFLTMRYVDSYELKSPPHLNFPAARLNSLGLEAEAIALLQYLPYLEIDDEISAWTIPYSYLTTDNNCQARDVHHEGANDLAPWVIRLTEVRTIPGYFGRTIIYDLRTKLIVQWSSNEGGYTNSYLGEPGTPVKEVFEEWIGWLRNLENIPWRDDYNRKVENSLLLERYCDLVTNGYQVSGGQDREQMSQDARDLYNAKLAKQNLFRSHGWPDNFRGDEFEEARKTWVAEYNRLSRLGTSGQGTLSSFLEQTAGEGAIGRAMGH